MGGGVRLSHEIVHPLIRQDDVVLHFEAVVHGDKEVHSGRILHGDQVGVVIRRRDGAGGDQLRMKDAVVGHGLVVLAVGLLRGQGHHRLVGVVSHGLVLVCAV